MTKRLDIRLTDELAEWWERNRSLLPSGLSNVQVLEMLMMLVPDLSGGVRQGTGSRSAPLPVGYDRTADAVDAELVPDRDPVLAGTVPDRRADADGNEVPDRDPVLAGTVPDGGTGTSADHDPVSRSERALRADPDRDPGASSRARAPARPPAPAPPHTHARGLSTSQEQEQEQQQAVVLDHPHGLKSARELRARESGPARTREVPSRASMAAICEAWSEVALELGLGTERYPGCAPSLELELARAWGEVPHLETWQSAFTLLPKLTEEARHKLRATSLRLLLRRGKEGERLIWRLGDYLGWGRTVETPPPASRLPDEPPADTGPTGRVRIVSAPSDDWTPSYDDVLTGMRADLATESSASAHADIVARRRAQVLGHHGARLRDFDALVDRLRAGEDLDDVIPFVVADREAGPRRDDLLRGLDGEWLRRCPDDIRRSTLAARRKSCAAYHPDYLDEFDRELAARFPEDR